ncbi:Inorganic pyrophosphatase [Rhodobacteraceae bacterium THAF1]|uniref:inorganic diphosphatase n=1 Tax=Palleronia sp. THAF1 TaxID=2587842 RepID=UPI000F3E49D6|nr:inorganic diphosphatase [Palleronia sp. THAF1]QFU10170.1 Inorganic pyrophosphatase [Palleronia sp. THAF1]VDC16925.1 Inorganic pyrophosphatase [Rhodobacteraceae bacterium THAF1]
MAMLDLKDVSPRNDDDTVNVFVETPKGSRHKYDIDDHGLVRIAIEMPEGVTFPCSFGFVPNTIAPDGDALDIVLLTAGEVPARSLIQARLIGVLKMENDEGGEMTRNDRVVAVATMSRVFSDITELEQLRSGFAWDIEQFFETYNDMIERPFKLVGRGNAEEARKMLMTAIDAA